LVSLKFIKKNEIAKNIFSFFFKPETEIKWLAGQYMQFTVQHSNPDSRGIKRIFTICSAPHEKDIVITTRIDPLSGSSLKKELIKMKSGAIISAGDPSGDFIITDDRKAIFAAGGIGITPIRSILSDLNFKDKIKGYELFYSNRDSDIAFKDEIEVYKNKSEDFSVVYFISPSRIDYESIKNIHDSYIDFMIYISGPANMVKLLIDVFIKAGALKENIKTDYFPGY